MNPIAGLALTVVLVALGFYVLSIVIKSSVVTAILEAHHKLDAERATRATEASAPTEQQPPSNPDREADESSEH